jgi:hypothetical protein
VGTVEAVGIGHGGNYRVVLRVAVVCKAAKIEGRVLGEDARVPAMNGWMKGGAAMVVMSALLFATGCPGFFVYPGSLTGGSSSTGDYVYVANGTAETLTAFSVGTGTLTEIGSPFSLGFVPTSLVVNPANTIVFVAG